LLGYTLSDPVATPAESVSELTLEDIEQVRRSGLFDADWYLAMYPDVRRAGVDPLLHYISHGAHEGREPSPYFNTRRYQTASPEATLPGVQPLFHYLKNGFLAG